MLPISRRDFLYLGLAASANLVHSADAAAVDVHEQLLELAAKEQERRRARFAAVKDRDGVQALQQELRQKFLDLLDGLPKAAEAPAVEKTGRINADDYTIDKLVYQSLPGYYVSALLYKPKKIEGRVPGILSPCGHSPTGKAANTYQVLHVNLVKRGAMVLTYDPVGQGERSQFWDAQKQRSRYNLTCGEHAVLGNPLYLLGTSLARYRIWDGMRGLDLLAALPEIDRKRLGCVGVSGGGTLTAYIAALDPRVQAAVIACYITTLPRRMGNRIQADPDSDPEQDIFGFVSEGIDHAGLLALRVPRPTLLAAAQRDFFPIEGTRESFAEAKKLFEAAGAGDKLALAEADERHGFSLPLRQAAYAWFERWLFDRAEPREQEIEVKPRPTQELHVCAEGQVNLSFRSKHLLKVAMEQLLAQTPKSRVPADLKDLLRLDPDAAAFHTTEVTPLKEGGTLIVCINGNESGDWREEKDFLKALGDAGMAVTVVDPRGVGKLRPALAVRGHDYADPLCGVEENIAYNAFLLGKVLLGMRVADVQKALTQLVRSKPARLVLCGRRDAAHVACFTAAIDDRVQALAAEEMLLSFGRLFDANAEPINAASIVPRLLRDFGDMDDVLATLRTRRALVAAARGQWPAERRLPKFLHIAEQGFSKRPSVLIEWLKG